MRKTVAYLIAIATCWMHVTICRTQTVLPSALPAEDRLPTHLIRCIYQDREGFIWYGTDDGLYRDDGYSTEGWRSDFNTPHLLASNVVTCLVEDPFDAQFLWLGTRRGAYRLHKQSGTLEPVEHPALVGADILSVSATDSAVWVATSSHLVCYSVQGEKMWTLGSAHQVVQDVCGRVWMVQRRGSLFRYVAPVDSFEQIPLQGNATGTSLQSTADGVWVGTWGGGLFFIDAASGVPKRKEKWSMRVNSLAIDSIYHHLWATTNSGVEAFAVRADGTLRRLELTQQAGIRHGQSVRSVICDRYGALWVTGNYPATASFVLTYSPLRTEYIEIPNPLDEDNFKAAPMQLFPEGNRYWIRQRRTGLYAYYPQEKAVVYFSEKNRYQSLFFEPAIGGGVYTVLGYHEVYKVDTEGPAQPMSEKLVCSLPAEERIRALHADADGRLWIGTKTALYCFDTLRHLLHCVSTGTGMINAIATDPDTETVLLATETQGLICLNIDGQVVARHATDQNFTLLATGPDRRVWAVTAEGCLYCYHRRQMELQSHTANCGLTGNVVNALLVDTHGCVWIAGDQLLTLYDPLRQKFRTLSRSHPSVRLENFMSLAENPNGTVYVGGRGGFVSVTHLRDDEPLQNAVPDRISVSRLRVEGRNAEIHLTTFNPVAASTTRFGYVLEQGGRVDLPAGQNVIRLNNLRKGHHHLTLYVTLPDGGWSARTTAIEVYRPPVWYETTLAHLLLILLVLAVLGWCIFRYRKHQQRKRQEQIDEQVAQMKYRFFTNVSHELRTPLSLIITPLDHIIGQTADPSLREQLQLIDTNAHDMLSLVNQLLDFRRVEMGGEVLCLSYGDVVEFTTAIQANFRSLAVEKGLQWQWQSQLTDRRLYFDADKLRKVLNNLLSNALKYTSQGSITLSLGECLHEGKSCLVFRVADTGMGIPAGQLEGIFERFHRVSDADGLVGTGIGLHIVREYVKMHRGTVTVQSTEGQGSTFTVYLPTDLAPEEQKQSSQIPAETCCRGPEVATVAAEDDDEADKQEITLLVIDDNEAFRRYVADELSKYYRVLEAADGLEGEQLADRQQPSIILTDLMMPGIDGIELCRRIKNNVNTAHIPVILLTANVNVENEQRGYKEGADAYLLKPFSWEMLLTRIRQLLEQHAERLSRFVGDQPVEPAAVTISPLDERLLTKANAILETNLSNTAYNVEEFSSDMCMSRSNLYRKMLSLTGLTPTDFIRNYRLQRGAELLRKGELSVVDVAYEVGFSSAGYFSRSFKKLFGVTPSQYL